MSKEDKVEGEAGGITKELFPSDERMVLAKARIAGDVVNTSNALPSIEDTVTTAFTKTNALEPPYDPRTMLMLYEHSNSLRQNVDAYKTNIDGHGHRFEPTVDIQADNATDRIRTAMLLDRQEQAIAEAEPGAEDPGATVVTPTDTEVQEQITKIQAQMDVEKLRLEHWFDYACDDMSFVELRRRSREDLEITGNAYWEVMRDGFGTPARLTYLPSHTVRLLQADERLTEVETEVPTASRLGTKKTQMKRRFRKFVQIHQGRTSYFKDFGDPRTMSAKTGEYYEDVKALDTAEGDGPKRPGAVATEVIHHRIHSSRSAYGIPRWVGNLLAVLGNRQAEEVNYLYFDNKSVPPLAVLISGGRLTDESVKRLEGYVENKIKGRKNFHSMLILEAEGGDSPSFENSGRMKIELKPLNEATHGDGLFMKYDERNMDKIGQSFRLPRLLRGDIRDFNRATADAALEFVEGQVFSPERQEFDFMLNRGILRDVGARWWKFRSNGTTKANPLELVKMLNEVQDIFPPKVLQEIAEEAFGRDFPDSDEDWVKVPLNYWKAGVRPGEVVDDETSEASAEDALSDQDSGGENTEKSAAALLQALISVRDGLALREKEASLEAMRESLGNTGPNDEPDDAL